jgi:ApaG protein
MLKVYQSEVETRGVNVHVRSRFLPERSQPENHAWLFVYEVTITNEGPETVQLLSRHWVITDANGKVEEVKGPGVVGATPTLASGESFDYQSFCHLSTEFGIMHGTFQMETEAGEMFDAEVAPFQLGEAEVVH